MLHSLIYTSNPDKVPHEAFNPYVVKDIMAFRDWYNNNPDHIVARLFIDVDMLTDVNDLPKLVYLTRSLCSRRTQLVWEHEIEAWSYSSETGEVIRWNDLSFEYIHEPRTKIAQ